MNKLTSAFFLLGSFFLISGIILFALIFGQVINQEIKYTITKPNVNKIITPADKNFGIVIPKIDANAKIIPEVDPYNSSIYQQALTKGVAHAKGTSYPNQDGNIFLFAHSSVDFYEAIKYNSVFYLLSKLEKGDKIDIYFKEQKYIYEMAEKKMVNPEDISYLTNSSSEKTLTLMTCWPPGTTYKRLLIIAKIENK
jgi:sortase A